jgi:Ni,Fe-hydrogenase maturation factor
MAGSEFIMKTRRREKVFVMDITRIGEIPRMRRIQIVERQNLIYWRCMHTHSDRLLAFVNLPEVTEKYHA